MSYPRDQGQRGTPSQPSNYQQHGVLDSSMDSRFKRSDHRVPPQSIIPGTPTPTSSTRVPDRSYAPTRASTVGSTSDFDRNHTGTQQDYGHHARSEDLSHSSSNRYNFVEEPGSLPGPSPPFMTSSRPNTPGSSGQQRQYQASSSGHSEQSDHRLSVTSHSSVHSTSSQSAGKSVVPSSTSAATSVASS